MKHMNHSEILAQSDEVHEKYMNNVIKNWNNILSCSHNNKESTITTPIVNLTGSQDGVKKPYTLVWCNDCRRMV